MKAIVNELQFYIDTLIKEDNRYCIQKLGVSKYNNIYIIKGLQWSKYDDPNDLSSERKEKFKQIYDYVMINNFNVKIRTNDWNIFDLILHNNKHKVFKNEWNNQHVYSEIQAGLYEQDGMIQTILLDTIRGDIQMDDTMMPYTNDNVMNYQFTLHSHPFEKGKINRIQNGILLESPSANDIVVYMNFQQQFTDRGLKSVEFIVCLEGIYTIQILDYNNLQEYDMNDDQKFNEFADKYNKLKFPELKDDDPRPYKEKLEIFHNKLLAGHNVLKRLNKFLAQYNLQVTLHRRQYNRELDIWQIPDMYVPLSI